MSRSVHKSFVVVLVMLVMALAGGQLAAAPAGAQVDGPEVPAQNGGEAQRQDGVEMPAQVAGAAAVALEGQLFDSFLYALHDSATGNHIYGFRADGAGVVLTLLPGFPVATGGSGDGNTFAERLAYDATNQRLFAINGESATLSAYQVDLASGGLTALPYHNTSLGTESLTSWGCVTVHPGGSPLVVGSTDASQVRSYAVSDTALVEAPGSPYATGGFDYSCAFSRDGGYVYSGVGQVYGFSVESATGALAALPGSPYTLGVTPVAYATDSAGRFFLANYTAGQLRVATSSAGVLSEVGGSPFVSGLSRAVHGLLHPAGFYMVADRGGNQVGVYEISGSGAGTTLAAAPGSPFATGAAGIDDSHILALDQGGNFLYVANGTTRNFSRFSVNQGTGALTNLGVTAADSLGADGRVTGLAMAPIPTDGLRILVHTDDPAHPPPDSYVERALLRLGLPYHATYNVAQAAFVDKLNSGDWDLVVFMADSYGAATLTLDALRDYVNGGGHLITYAYNLGFSTAHPLWATLGVGYQQDILDEGGNIPIYQWDSGHSLFNIPEDLPSPLDWSCGSFCGAFIGGQRVTPLPGFAALAGYTASPAANEAAMIVGNGGRTIYKAFGDAWHDDSDNDGDGVADAVELWVNLVSHMTTPPTVTAITRAGPSPTNAASVAFNVTFSKNVTGVDVGDFALTASGTVSGASVTNVSGSGAEYVVTVLTGTGGGTLQLYLPVTATIVDLASQPLAGLPYTSGEIYTIDRTAPTVTAITRAGPSPTNAASVDFNVTFSEAVTGVGAGDFALATTGALIGASVTSVGGSGANYVVTVATGTGSGTLRLDVPATATIDDLAGNGLVALPYTSGQAYTIDRQLRLYLPLVQRDR